MKRNLLIACAAIVAVALAGTWYLGSPSWTLYQMRGAADAGDIDSLSSYIDFPALRANLKEEFKAKAAAEMLKLKGDGMEALGAMFATTMVDGLVDAMVTPATMRKVFIADKARAGEGMTKIDATKADMVVDREGFDHFVLHEKSKPAAEGGLIFTRHGLGWMLSGMRLPDEIEKAAVQPSNRATEEKTPVSSGSPISRTSPLEDRTAYDESAVDDYTSPVAEAAPSREDTRALSRRRWGGGYMPTAEAPDAEEVSAMNQQQLDVARRGK